MPTARLPGRSRQQRRRRAGGRGVAARRVRHRRLAPAAGRPDARARCRHAGRGRPLRRGPAAPDRRRPREAVEAVAASDAAVLSVDIPSGISATTGEIVGSTDAASEGGVAVRADATLTFVGPKRGFFLGAGPAHVGEWAAAEIGFPAEDAWRWLAERRARAG
ncbi:MAG: NAD(P)H-hydrate epimerase [Planctomycetota bacterium]